MKRLLESLPTGLVIIGGIGLIAAIVSPFLLEMISGPPRSTIEISNELENIPGIDAESNSKSSQLRRVGSVLPKGQTYDRFGDIRLDTALQSLQQRFKFQWENSPTNTPAIYLAVRQQGLDVCRAHFYDNVLKEFFLVLPPTTASPEAITEQLHRLLGELPQWLKNREEVSDDYNPGSVVSGMLRPYPERQQVAWSDGENRIDAVIYSRITNTGQRESLLTVHVRAANWIKVQAEKEASRTAIVVPETGNKTDSAVGPDSPGPLVP